MTQQTTRIVTVIAAFLGGLAIFSVAIFMMAGRLPTPIPAPSAIGGPFSLVDQTGKPVTEADLKGKPSLMFFGFTHCPDICPTALFDMTQVYKALGRDGDKVQAYFVSVDPERDTPEVLKSYVENFSPDLVGLTGTPEQVAAVAKVYRVYYAKSGKTDTPDYLVDHSSIIYLMDPQGRFVKHFTYTTDAAALASSLADVMAATP